MSTTFSVPAQSFRRLPNPLEEGVETYEFYIQVKHVPGLDNIPMDTNPRDQQLTSQVATEIQNSLTTNKHQLFHILNKGITLSADRVQFDNKTNEARVVFDDPTIHGNIDGGHTLKIVLQNQENALAAEKYVKFEVLTGLDSENFVAVAEARNTAAKVEAFTIAELQNKFDVLKEALGDEPFMERVTFKQFEDKNNKRKNIPVRQLLAVLNLFNVDRYGNENHPIVSYSGKQATVKYYLDYYNELPLEDNPFYKMRPIMKKIFRLYAYIDENYSKYFKGNYLNWKFAKLDKGQGPRVIRFSNDGKTVGFKVPEAILLPIVAAFRALVQEDENGEYKWIDNPFDYVESLVPRMTEIIYEKLKNNGSNPNAVGKDGSLWLTLYMMVEMEQIKKARVI